MTRRLSLEDFDDTPGPPAPAPDPAPAPPDPGVDLEALRLEAYEAGYKSGWDDCHAEHLKSEAAVASDLAQALKDLEFTYHEARGDVLAAIRPVIDTMVERLLPRLAAEGLPAAVAGELLPALSAAADLDPELLAAPETLPVLRDLADRSGAEGLRIRSDPAFGPAQVSLRLGAEAREIDLGEAVERIGQELREFTGRLIAETPETGPERGART